MFAKDGWVSFEDVQFFIARHISEKAESDSSFDEYFAHVNSAVEVFLWRVERAALLTPSGEMFAVGPSLLARVCDAGTLGFVESRLFRKRRAFAPPSSAIISTLIVDATQDFSRPIPSLFPYICFGFAAAALPIYLYMFTADAETYGQLGYSSTFLASWMGASLGLGAVGLGFNRMAANENKLAGASLIFRAADLEAYLSTPETSEEDGISERSVTRKIIELFDAGDKFVKSDIQMMLGHRVSARGFQRAWDAARQERPELGKPGRRPIS